MAILKVCVKSFVKPNEDFNKALDHCKQRLYIYFKRCIGHSNNKLFNSVEVTSNVHSNMVGEMDLLVYITASHANRLIRNRFVRDTAGGATSDFSDGVYCEVYADRAMDEGKLLFGLFGANQHKQGMAMANCAFHELAHNKWRGLPEELRRKYNVTDVNENIHQVGEGLMKGALNEGEVANLDATNRNIEIMASLIQYPVKQSTNVPVYSNRW